MITPDILEMDFVLLCRSIGLLGFGLYVFGFFCLCTGRLGSATPTYFALVLAASCCVMVSLWADFNLSAALIQGFYIMMSAGGIVLRLRGDPFSRAPDAL